jgi:hypothetical protein
VDEAYTDRPNDLHECGRVLGGLNVRLPYIYYSIRKSITNERLTAAEMGFGLTGVGAAGPWYVMEAQGNVNGEAGVDWLMRGWERTREKEGKGGSRCIAKRRGELVGGVLIKE